MYLNQLLCARNSYLHYIEWISHWYQKFTFHNVFSSQKLFTWFNYLRETNNTDRNGVTHTHTHTHQSLRKITLARASLHENKWYPLVKDSPIPLVFPTPPYLRQKLEPPFFQKHWKLNSPFVKGVVQLCHHGLMKIFISSRWQMFFKISALKNFAIFCIKKSLIHRYFSVNIANFLRTSLIQNFSGGCFCDVLKVIKQLFR